MPWKEMDAMLLRAEFVALAMQAGSNIRELCRRYQISSRTAYKWLKRYAQEGEAGLKERSKRPKHIPKQTQAEMEAKVLEIREETGWGGRKIARHMQDQGFQQVPHANTITDILRRAGKLEQAEQDKHQPYQRFERSQPNELWQMDFKGHFATLTLRCHPFTVLDDHSRFCLGLKACANETGPTVKKHLTSIFRQYGLPKAILCDNGGPWGSGYPELELSELAVWLIRTNAPLILHHNVPVLVVSRILGHDNLSITLNTCAHLYHESQAQAAKLMNELVSPLHVALPGTAADLAALKNVKGNDLRKSAPTERARE